MRQIFYLLISLVIFSTITYAESFPQAFAVPVTINANNCTISFDAEDDNADFSFNITSPLCNATNTSNAFTFSKQVSLLLIRNVSCGETNIENLTKTCVELFSQVDFIGNFTECREGKARLEEGFKSLHEQFSGVSSSLANVTVNFSSCSDALNSCRADSVNRGNELTQCFQDKSKETLEKEKAKGERITFAIISAMVAVGIVMYILRTRNPKNAFPEQQAKIMNPEFKDVMEEKLGRKGN